MRYAIFYSWKSDAQMGRQTLTGISPLHMERCHALPEYFNVTDEDVKHFLEGKTLEEAMEVQYFFHNK